MPTVSCNKEEPATKMNYTSRITGDCHVRFCKRFGVSTGRVVLAVAMETFSINRHSLQLFQLPDTTVTDKKGKETKKAKRTIDQLPVKGNMADRAGDECQGEYHYTGDDAEL
jgi:hypothetical protein